MAKARMYGMKTSFVPNRQADSRFRKGQFLRSKGVAESRKRIEKVHWHRIMRDKEKDYGNPEDCV